MIRAGNVVLVSLLVSLGMCWTACASSAVPTAKSAVATEQPSKTQAASDPKGTGITPTPKPSLDQPRYGGILTVSTLGDPVTLDMHQEVSMSVQNVVQPGYNALVQPDPNDPEKIIGDLAKSWEVSKDGLVYTFVLNDNVKFHDGSPFSSEDVRVSFARQIDPPQGVRAGRRANFAAVDKVEAPSKDTVRFVTKYPSGVFLTLLGSGFMSIYSKAFVEKKGHMKNDIMGTGPYKLKRYSIGISLEFEKNPDYFVKGRPYLDGMVFYVIKDSSTRFAAFRTGQVKLTGLSTAGPSPAQADMIIRDSPQAVVVQYPSYYHTTFLPNNLEQPWTDIRVRRAVHLAIDRQAAIKVISQGYGEIGSYMPGKWGIPKEELEKMPGWRQPKDADIQEARKLLADAGFPDGFRVRSLVRGGIDYESIATYAVDQLSKIGIKLDLDIQDNAVRSERLQQGAFNNHPGLSGINDPDPEDVFRFWAPPLKGEWGQNWQRSSDEKIWELFDKQSRAVDPAERKKIVRELDLRMIETLYRIQIHWRTDVHAMWPEVKNRGVIVDKSNSSKYQDVWLAK